MWVRFELFVLPKTTIKIAEIHLDLNKLHRNYVQYFSQVSNVLTVVLISIFGIGPSLITIPGSDSVNVEIYLVNSRPARANHRPRDKMTN